MTPAPPKPPPPPPPPMAPPSNRATPGQASRKTFTIGKGRNVAAQIIVLYGPGGVGKSELCANMHAIGLRPMWLDIGHSTKFLDVHRVEGLENWKDLRDAVQAEELWQGTNAIVIDDLTKAEELAAVWTFDNVLKESRDGTMERVSGVEGYGWGKGYQHVYDTFLTLLGDLDRHIRCGRHVVCIAHECTSTVPNPAGEDFLRYEPRLQSMASGKASIRYRVKEWCDHLLFIGYDINAKKDGKAQGSGTRTIYPVEMPTHLAKSRCLTSPIPYQRGSADVWAQLFGVKQ